MYVVLGQWIAGGLVGVTEETLMQGYWVPFVRGLVGAVFAPGTRDLHDPRRRVRRADDDARPTCWA